MSTIYTPKKRIYAPDDPFFEEGNIALRAIWLQKQAQSEIEYNMIKEEASNLATYVISLRAIEYDQLNFLSVVNLLSSRYTVMTAELSIQTF